MPRAATQRPSRGSGSSGSWTRPTAASALYDETFWSLRASPKELPPVWLYDERGSRLFDGSPSCPSTTRPAREQEILTAHAAEIAASTGARTLVELGAGTSAKTRTLLDALSANGTLERFVPLDASEEVLRASASAIADAYPIAVHAIVGDFERHLSAIPRGENRLVAFLGSTIGNLHPDRRARLLAAIAATLGRATRSCSVSISSRIPLGSRPRTTTARA